MAGEKFLKHDGGGGLAETVATQIGGAGAADKIPSLDAAGRLDQTMMPTGVAAETAVLVTSESLTANDFVNVYDNGGTATLRRADATTAGRIAHGFVKTSTTSGAVATVFFDGNNDAVTGATAGEVFLSTTAGGFTSTAPSTAGNVVQSVGIATSATSINFEAGKGIVVA
jgi:hypothetical protein